jgi:fumarate reductase subunit C
MAERRPYRRSMEGWWKRNPYFKRYMAREVTAFFVALYGLLMVAGVVKLAEGPAAFAGWMELMRSGWSIALHVVLLAVFVYHTYSWFEIMPKTMPPVVVGGKRLEGGTITNLGITAAALASVVVLAIAWGLAK